VRSNSDSYTKAYSYTEASPDSTPSPDSFELAGLVTGES
jgi:hypothetical protein